MKKFFVVMGLFLAVVTGFVGAVAAGTGEREYSNVLDISSPDLKVTGGGIFYAQGDVLLYARGSSRVQWWLKLSGQTVTNKSQLVGMTSFFWGSRMKISSYQWYWWQKFFQDSKFTKPWLEVEVVVWDHQAKKEGALEFRLYPRKGDVNGDGRVSKKDAEWVLESTTGARQLTSAQKWAGDVDTNLNVSALDAKLILQYVAGNIAEFPAEKLLFQGFLAPAKNTQKARTWGALKKAR